MWRVRHLSPMLLWLCLCSQAWQHWDLVQVKKDATAFAVDKDIEKDYYSSHQIYCYEVRYLKENLPSRQVFYEKRGHDCSTSDNFTDSLVLRSVCTKCWHRLLRSASFIVDPVNKNLNMLFQNISLNHQDNHLTLMTFILLQRPREATICKNLTSKL